MTSILQPLASVLFFFDIIAGVCGSCRGRVTTRQPEKEIAPEEAAVYTCLAATDFVQEALRRATRSRLQALDVMRERKGGGPYAPTRGILLFHTRRLAFGVVFFLLRQESFFVRPHDNDIDDVSGTQLLGFRFEPLFFFSPRSSISA